MKNYSFYSVKIECQQPSDDLFLKLADIIHKRQKLYPRAKRIGYNATGYNNKEYWFCIKTRCIKPCIRKVVGNMKGLNIKKITWKRVTHDHYRKEI